MEAVKALQAEYHDQFTKHASIAGTGVGYKHVNGIATTQEALLVFVVKKGEFHKNAAVPSQINGIPVDVIEVGKLVKHDVLTSRIRPIRPGYSCGHGRITAGTVGGFFIDKDGDHVVLSNAHVLANENNAEPGDPIFQPGPIDAPPGDHQWRGWSDPIASLPYFATLKTFVRLTQNNNMQDSAIAVIPPAAIAQNLINPIYPFINRPLAGWGEPTVGLSVQKVGRTTGHTAGKIIALSGQFGIEYDFGIGNFVDCVVITNCSSGGDSGSIIVDANMNAVALLFAGSDKVTLATPISYVRNQYGLSLWSGSSTPNFTLLSLSSPDWAIQCSPGSSLVMSNGTIQLSAKANQSCCAEHAVTNVTQISCSVNTGSDGGATWGPGIVLQFPTEMVKVNLRKGGSFGGYFNTNEYLGVGSVEPNTWYDLRIRCGNTVALEARKAGADWSKIMELPRNLMPHAPTMVRVGKTDGTGQRSDYSDLGGDGQCQIKDVQII